MYARGRTAPEGDGARRRLGVLVAVAALTTATAIAVAPPAAAAPPSITAPANGNAGAQAQFSGASWAPYANVNLFLVSTGSTFFCTVRADSTGTIPAQTCALPLSLPAGSYTVHADDGNGHTDDANAPLVLKPSVSMVNPFTGQLSARYQAGDTLRISGNGFGPSVAITSFKLGTTTLTSNPATVASNAQGQFSNVLLTLPAAQAAGPVLLKATDAAGNVGSYTVTIYRATVTAPVKGSAGSPIVISGTKWPAGVPVNTYLVGTFNTFFCTLQSQGDGSLTAQSCTVPSSLPAGSYTLLLSDGGGVTVRQAFTLNPGLNPTSTFSGAPTTNVAAGGTLRLAGSGFAASSSIATAKLGAKNVPLSPAGPPTNTAGQFSNVIGTIPASAAAGPAKLTVTDAAGNAAAVTLNVYQATITAPANGAAGTPIIISGSGWPAFTTVNEYLVGTFNTFFCSLTSDGTGAIAPQACTVPSSLPAGSYALTLTDGSVTVSKPFAMKASISVTNSSGQPMASGAPGDAVRLAGNGFTASSTITSVQLGTKKINTVPSVPTTSTAGQFNSVTFAVPNVPAGTYTLTVTDAAGKVATVQFSVS